MSSIISKFTRSSIVSSIILFGFAILLITQSEATIMTISYVIGGILVALGVLAELRFIKNIKDMTSSLDIIYGICCVILGILVIKNPEAIASAIPLVIGFIIVVSSAMKLQYSLELRKEKNELWLSTLILSVITTICGIVLIFNPFEGAKFLTTIVGIFILVYAVLDLISTIVIHNTFKKIQTEINKKMIKDAEVLEEESTEEKEETKKTNKKKEEKED